MSDGLVLVNPYEQYLAQLREAVDALAALVENPQLTSKSTRVRVLRALFDLEVEVTCGDCDEGRCHWGGERSRESIAAANAGGDWVHPTGRCGCARHEISVEVRGRWERWRSAGLAPDVVDLLAE